MLALRPADVLPPLTSVRMVMPRGYRISPRVRLPALVLTRSQAPQLLEPAKLPQIRAPAAGSSGRKLNPLAGLCKCRLLVNNG